ncbi:ABC transporter permease [Sulfurospirillum cavolei]|uniref:ABC transporter permease n=1 Tax=Sulfurospirillum cavolei TaxID=366522 RepID=UPI000764C455|nr:ABC transporter permease [Sulfurospirillum cavolei]
MQTIALSHLLFMIIPLSIVGYAYYRWVGKKGEIAQATLRMSVQLILVGYVLTSLFETNTLWMLSLLLIVMVTTASFIARRNIPQKDFKTFGLILVSIVLGGSFNLAWVLWVVLELNNPFDARFVIPLAGMIYANAMNALSLAAERYEKEKEHLPHEKARSIAFKASMIPQINQFLAVGFVSLPGMMTGQILSGVDPLVAVRYQIVVMAMILCSGAMSNIIYLAYLPRLYK